jgi:hypothetical protein
MDFLPQIQLHLLSLGENFKSLISWVKTRRHFTLKLRNQIPKFKIKFSLLHLELFDLGQILPMNKKKITHFGEGH